MRIYLEPGVLSPPITLSYDRRFVFLQLKKRDLAQALEDDCT